MDLASQEDAEVDVNENLMVTAKELKLFDEKDSEKNQDLKHSSLMPPKFVNNAYLDNFDA